MLSPAPRPRRALLVQSLILTLSVAVAVGAGVVAAPSAVAGDAPVAVARSFAALERTGQLPTLALPEAQAVEVADLVPAGPDWTIPIGAIGLQAEVDSCIWVRMDFSSAVPLPIVGAHNFCGGGIVLEMLPGQTVALSGAGLDGTYVVGEERDARADDYAEDAIAGMTGDVVLQTCHWADDGTLRLVALTRVG